MVPNPWVGIGLVLFVLVALFGVLRLVQLRYAVNPEYARKALHMAMGSVALSFPWLFAQARPVILLAGVSMALFAVLRFFPPFRRGFGAVIYSVERESLGEFYFPAGILAAFLISSDDVFIYSISVLTLAFADPAAAFVGMRCGRPWYWGRRSAKSIQGSLGFLVVTLGLAFLSLQMQADADAVRSLLVAMNLAILLMVVEASARKGLDNLLIPVSAAFLLQWLLTCSVPILSLVLVGSFVVTLALSAIAGGRASAREKTPSGLRKLSPGTTRATSMAS